MADEKRYYWLKLKKDFFKRHDIQIIESMPNGKDYVLFYLKLLVESVDHNGNLRFNNTIPYSESMLSTITNTNIDIVRSAMKIFIELKMIDVLKDETIFMSEIQKMLGTETYWAEQKRKQREDKPPLLGQCPQKVLVESNLSKQEIEIDKELDKDKEKEYIPYQEIMESFNQICLSLPNIKEITSPRKKAINGRWKQLNKNINDCIEFFKQVEKSDWLSGRNEKGWKASFDWIMKPVNFTKIMEGNFVNKSGIRPVRQQSKREESLDEFGRMCDEFDRRRSEATSRYDYRSIPGRV